MLRLESIYARLPIPLQNVACTVEGWRADRVRFGRGWAATRSDVFARGDLSETDVQTLRDARLRMFLRHAGETVPYYREIWRDLHVNIGEIATLEDLTSLPILTKADVQNAGSLLMSQVIPRKQRVAVHTSGTTGAGLRFF